MAHFILAKAEADVVAETEPTSASFIFALSGWLIETPPNAPLRAAPRRFPTQRAKNAAQIKAGRHSKQP